MTVVRRLALIVLLLVPATVRSDDLDSPIAPEGILGTVVLCGSECPPHVVENAIENAVTQNPLLNADRVAISIGEHPEMLRATRLVKGNYKGIFRRILGGRVSGLRNIASRYAGEPVWLIWLHVEEPQPEDEVTAAQFLEACTKIRDRGGIIILSGHAASWLATSHDTGIIPGCRITTETHHKEAPSDENTPSDEGTAGRFELRWSETSLVTLRGRRLSVPRDVTSGVEIVLREGAAREPRVIPLAPGSVQDLTALRRAAHARTQPLFPPEEPLLPEVPHGTLMLVGGGLSDEMVQTFVETAGGATAKIVIIPTAQQSPSQRPEELLRFRRAGAGEVVVLHATTRDEAASEEFLQPLRDATGVWFTGGRQWRLVDRYEGTPFVEACRDVLARDGIVGGTSAGATILGDYLVRGNPLGNSEIMAEGYERGFAFLPGAAIDQHVSQRSREPQLLMLNKTYPQLLTIGLDERTVLIVRGDRGMVSGVGNVYFLDRSTALNKEPAVRISAGKACCLPRIREEVRP